MMSALKGERELTEKQTTVLIGSVSVTMTREGGGQKAQNFVDVIYE